MTLHERVDLLAAGHRLDELGNLRSLTALNEKATLLRLVGRLDEAWSVAGEAVRLVRFTGDREELLGARIRRAQVAHARGKLDDAHTELSGCVDEARIHEWTELEALAVEGRGRVSYDRGDYQAALPDFTAAVFLREKAGASSAELESALIAVAVTESFLDEQRG